MSAEAQKIAARRLLWLAVALASYNNGTAQQLVIRRIEDVLPILRGVQLDQLRVIYSTCTDAVRAVGDADRDKAIRAVQQAVCSYALSRDERLI